MIEVVLTAHDAEALRRGLTNKRTELCAVLYAARSVKGDGNSRLLVRETYFPTEEQYSRRGEFEAELTPELVARVSKRGRRENLALVFVHSHPGDDAPHFSPVDDKGETHLARFLERRNPGHRHAAMVVSRGGLRARELGTEEFARVISVGAERRVLFEPDPLKFVNSEVFDRQIRAFGREAQRLLGDLTVGIVGLGGVGAIVVQQLAHLGVRRFILIDPDTVAESNLNRLPNAARKDIGEPKVEVAKRYVHSISEEAAVTALCEDVIYASTARRLLDADVFFCCTDSHGSRAVLQQVCYQYLIPCIDIGTVIATGGETITHVYGRVQMLGPGLACLTCGALLDPNQVRTDMMTEFERQSDPYVLGSRVPAPAVISLNGTAASLAVTMFLGVVAGMPVNARHVLYNALSSTLRAVRGEPDPKCYICSHEGALARGDSWPILGRHA